MEGTPTIPRTSRPKKPKAEKGEKGDLKKRNLEEMRSGQDDADMEFGPNVKREIPERPSDSLATSGGSRFGGASSPPASASAFPLAVEGPSNSPEPYPVQPSIETNEPIIKLEPDDADKMVVKLEPKHEE
jgi:hypothetical protein